MGLGSNILKDNAVERAGKSLGQTVKVLNHFDEDYGIKEPSNHHSKRSKEKDMLKLVKQIKDTSTVFDKVEGRMHQNFPRFEANSFRKLDMKDIIKWMEGRKPV